ncbi:MAG TPA: ketoacyl-ACP synthase III [Segetibacter sp.]|jgi:3-oxoacyl-[acyl-carrier-protein] synthase-3
MKKAFIKDIHYYLPKEVLDNETISRSHPEWSIEKIAAKTGIYERHIAAEDEFSSDMAVKAAEKLFSLGQVDRNSIDFVILCTQSPDYFLPTTACILQDRLNLSKNIGAFDFNLGCSGFIYGLGICKGLIATGQATNILLITSETYSKFVHADDKSSKTLFGDAAAATLISENKDDNELAGEILDFTYSTDGTGAEHLMVKNGGMKNRYVRGATITDESGYVSNTDNLFMDGKAIFNFTALQIPALIKDTLAKNKLAMEEIDLFVFHQANEFMLQTIRKRAGIPEEKFLVHLRDCGNTVSSTIPIALCHAVNEKKIKPRNKVLLSGFGVGLSAGGVVIQY